MPGNGDERITPTCVMTKMNTTLTSLNLGCEEKKKRRGNEKEQMTGNEIRNEGLKVLSEMLKVNTTLTTLNLGSEGKR